MMTVRRFNSLLLLALLTVSGSSSRKVVGRAGEDVTLPCKYDIKEHGPRPVFWGRGLLSLTSWREEIISTNGSKVRTRASSRYQLLGRLEDGDVSLTILNTTEEDAGLYKCRVQTGGWFSNDDEKHHIDLTIEKVSGSSSTEVVGRAGEDVTLPCKYDIKEHGPRPVFWNRVSESLTISDEEIISTDGSKVTTRASSRYQLLGRLEDGDVSLTILNTTEEDAGLYGCRVEIDGSLINDESHYIDLSIEKVSGSSSRKVVGRAGEDVTLSCKYDIRYHGPTAVCWGRGPIPIFGCINQIISTDGYKVIETTRASSRYQLLGRLKDGDVSLMILNTTEEDAGRYGCRVKTDDWLVNDEKHHIDLTIEKETTEQTPQTEQTIHTSGQVTVTTSSTSIDSEQQEAGRGVLVFMVRVLLAVIALVTAGVATVIGRRWNQHKIPQQQSVQLVQFSSNSSALELQVVQIDAGGNSDCVYEVRL